MRWVAEWSGALVSPPAIFRLRVRFPSPLGHATLYATGALVTRYILTMDVNYVIQLQMDEIHGASSCGAEIDSHKSLLLALKCQ